MSSSSDDFDADPIRSVARLLCRLPGVGEKSARRMVYGLLSSRENLAAALGEAISKLPERVRHCDMCGAFTGYVRCTICADVRREEGLLCVVARPWDVDAFERSGFRGRYHVLHALLDPLNGFGPDRFPMQPLLDRVHEHGVNEVILATPATVEGESTALYIAEALRTSALKVTRIASGIPHGGDLEYADPVTLTRALEGRRGL